MNENDAGARPPDADRNSADNFAVISEHMMSSGFLRLIGMEMVSCGGREASMRLPVKEELLQAQGIIHGGVIGALIDTVIGAAVMGALTGRGHIVAIEFKVNFFRPARVGDVLLGEAEILHLGKSTASGVARVRNQRDEMVAAGTGTYMRLPTPPAPSVGA